MKKAHLPSAGLEVSLRSDAIRLCYARRRTRSMLLARRIGPSGYPQAGVMTRKNRREIATIEVVAALIYRSGRLLVCQRKENGPFPLKWEFPGGKVEQGEEYFSALQRELREEIGIEIVSATEILRHNHSYSGRMEVKLIFFRVEDYQGEVVNLAFHRLLWAEVQKLKELDFLDGDLPLIEKLTREGLPY